MCNLCMTSKSRRIYVDGIFDLFHYGHMEMFARIKKIFPTCHIIVGISKDCDTTKYKRKPILNSMERYQSIIHCKEVDEIIRDVPWIIDKAFIDKYNIDYICHDPIAYPSETTDDVYKEWKNKGIFIGINRTNNISSSNIIERIKNSHQM